MSYHLNTKRGYSFPAVSSAMQKAIRRGDAKLAGYWALELWASGFGQYVWRRLLTVSAEDCWGILTQEVKALHDSYTEINRNTPAKTPKGRIFISKAVILLCLAKKSRDADHLQNFVYDQQAGLDAGNPDRRTRTRRANTSPSPTTPMTATRRRAARWARPKPSSSVPSRTRSIPSFPASSTT